MVHFVRYPAWPSEVHVAPAMFLMLRNLSGAKNAALAVITGRAIEDARCRLPIEVTFAGNHGLEIQGPDFEFVHPGAVRLEPRLAEACDSLEDVVRRWKGAWVERKRLSATLHYRLVDRHAHNALLFASRRCLSPFCGDFALRAGKLALEVRPKVGWDKGSAVRYIRERLGGFDACVCLGDDRTDECMFDANRGQINIRVGGLAGSTAAGYYLSDPGEVAIMLSHIGDAYGIAEPMAETAMSSPP